MSMILGKNGRRKNGDKMALLGLVGCSDKFRIFTCGQNARRFAVLRSYGGMPGLSLRFSTKRFWPGKMLDNIIEHAYCIAILIKCRAKVSESDGNAIF